MNRRGTAAPTDVTQQHRDVDLDRIPWSRRATVAAVVGAVVPMVLTWLGDVSAFSWESVTLSVVAALAVYGAVEDAQTLRIPNDIVLFALATVLVGGTMVAITGPDSLGTVVRSVLVGVVLSGTPFAFGLWVARPALIGGGDWKLLAVLGASIGIWAPLAAPFILLVASLTQIGQRIVRRHTELPLGPGLAVGYVVALLATALNDLGGLV